MHGPHVARQAVQGSEEGRGSLRESLDFRDLFFYQNEIKIQ